MRIDAQADMSDLAALAQRQNDDIRPLLLRVHTQAFVGSPARGRALVDEYEALALGLLPLVPDDVAAETQALLRDIPEVPTRLVSALRNRLVRTGGPASDRPDASRLGGTEPDGATLADMIGRADPETDLSLAANRRIRIDGHALATLVERARRDRSLAIAILDRPEPTVFDRAALYGFCDEGARDNIRLELAVRLGPASVPTASLPSELRDDVIVAAEAEDSAWLFATLAISLGLPLDWTCDLTDPAGRELFVLALSAAGLSVPDCTRVVLVVDARIARSVGSVFRLAAVARETPRHVAAYLVGRERDSRHVGRPVDDGERRASGPTRAGRAASGWREPALGAVSRDLSAPPGHRWQSTTGRDRT